MRQEYDQLDNHSTYLILYVFVPLIGFVVLIMQMSNMLENEPSFIIVAMFFLG